jgi:hypothetical protein
MPTQVLPTNAELPPYAETPAVSEAPHSGVEERSGRAKPKQAEIVAVNFEAAGGVAAGLVTAHPKPAKRLNAKERAKANAKDGIRPDMKAKAKSKAAAKAAKAKRKKDREG